MTEIYVYFFSSDVFAKLSLWLKCWYKLMVQIYHIFKILYLMIKCQNFYTAVSNMNKNILTVVDIFKALSFLWTCLIFHICYLVLLIVSMYWILTIPRCTQYPWADFSASFGEPWIHCNSFHEWKLLKNTCWMSVLCYQVLFNVKVWNVLKYFKAGHLPRLMQPSIEHSLQPSNLRQIKVQDCQALAWKKILKCLHFVISIPVHNDLDGKRVASGTCSLPV